MPPDGRGIARKGEQAPVFVRRPLEVEQDNTYDLFHSPQVLADCWQALAGRKAAVVRQPTQQQFEPLVSAPVVSVNSRVVYILRQLIGGSARKLGQLFPAARAGAPMWPPFWPCWNWCAAGVSPSARTVR